MLAIARESGSRRVPNTDTGDTVSGEKVTRPEIAILDVISDNIPVAVFVKDARSLAMVRINKTGALLLGHSKEELLGKTPFDLFEESTADHISKWDRLTLEHGNMVDLPESRAKIKGVGERV